MSYRKAWLMLQGNRKTSWVSHSWNARSEAYRAEVPSITPEGKKFLKSYEAFREDVRIVLEKTFKKHFK